MGFACKRSLAAPPPPCSFSFFALAPVFEVLSHFVRMGTQATKRRSSPEPHAVAGQFLAPLPSPTLCFDFGSRSRVRRPREHVRKKMRLFCSLSLQGFCYQISRTPLKYVVIRILLKMAETKNISFSCLNAFFVFLFC